MNLTSGGSQNVINNLLAAFDLAGTFVFALSGATAAVRHRLGLFCVAGADKALAFHAGPVAATLLGMVTGIGGGIVRDVLVMEVPNILRTELYAVAALLGAAFTVTGQRLGMPLHLAAPIGTALCIALRLLALRYCWRQGRILTPWQPPGN